MSEYRSFKRYCQLIGGRVESEESRDLTVLKCILKDVEKPKVDVKVVPLEDEKYNVTFYIPEGYKCSVRKVDGIYIYKGVVNSIGITRGGIVDLELIPEDIIIQEDRLTHRREILIRLKRKIS